MFEYRANLVRVVDGDTVVLDVDLGFNTWLHQLNFRLLGINAREIREAGGKQAKAYVASLLPVGSSVVLTSVRDDKYGGRFLAILTTQAGLNVNEHLVETGWAAAWDGVGQKPTPTWPRPE